MDGLIVVCILAVTAVIAAFVGAKRAAASKFKPHPMAGMKFKSNQAFFDCECQFGDERIILKRPMVALVEADETGLATALGLGLPPADTRSYRVRVANSTGGKTVHATILAAASNIRIGDLVAWVPLHHDNRHFEFWHGAIVAKLLPEFVEAGVRVETYY